MTRREFTLTHVLDAPRELVWKAWTEPEQLAGWWGPEGLHTPLKTIEMNVRAGGAFRLTMVLDADGTERSWRRPGPPARGTRLPTV